MSSARFVLLQAQQVDDSLSKWRSAKLPQSPPSGWLRAVRSSLRMSATALAHRLGVDERAIRKLERAEQDGAITLATLRRAAEALECELQYALVPRKPLQDMLMDRARALAEAEMAPVAHSMALEGQAVEADERRRHVDVAAQVLLQQGKRLWR